MATTTPTLSLAEVDKISRDTTDATTAQPCHIFGFLLLEDRAKLPYAWLLADESLLSGIRITLRGPPAEYPQPKPGDSIRIHRLMFDKTTRAPIITQPRNVLVWPAFQHQPVYYTNAKSPTITEHDLERRRGLEAFYFDTFIRIAELSNQKLFYNVAGCVEKVDNDKFNNIHLTLKDASGSAVVRVFPKKDLIENNDHYEAAKALKPGDFVVVTNVKRDSKRSEFLDLSANLNNGKSLRPVERSSIFGVKLAESIGLTSDSQELTQSCGSETTNSNATVRVLRRSPRKRVRFEAGQVAQASLTEQEITNSIESENDTSSQEEFPPYTKLADIASKREGSFEFYDIAGLVKVPPILNRFNHYLLQLYDGSKPKYVSFYIDEIGEPANNSAAVIVYAPSLPGDTSKHIETAKNLTEGDVVFIKNVKASWKNGKLKLELNANLQHGKSITVLDRMRGFGAHLWEIVTCPDVEELREDFHDSFDDINGPPELRLNPD